MAQVNDVQASRVLASVGRTAQPTQLARPKQPAHQVQPVKSVVKSGFTLIELLVVMAIIGILSAVAFGSFQTSQAKARDAQRKNDLKQMGVALEAYYNDHGQYPLNSADYKINGCAGVVATCDWGDEWSDDNGTIYMSKLPADPGDNIHYYYFSDGSYYQLYARLENNQDGDVPVLSNQPANYGISCGDFNCNFGLASSNVQVDTGRTLVQD